MQLTRIKVEGYKSFKSLDVEMRPLNVLIGANGAGKSNFLSLFRLINQMMDEKLQEAVQIGGGANAFLHYGGRKTEAIVLDFFFGQNGYHCVLKPTQDSKLVFSEEKCLFVKPNSTYSQPYEEWLGRGHLESALPTVVSDQEKSGVPGFVLQGLKSWKFFHFHDTSDFARVKDFGPIHDDVALRSDAGNLAAFLYRLKATHSKKYDLIRKTIRLAAPFFDDFYLLPDRLNPNQIRLEWRARGSEYPFAAYQLSDGTLRFICLVTLLMSPKEELPSVILIDEPELGLHPYAISLLASLLRMASRQSQIIISTQSPRLVDEFEVNDVLVVDHSNGESKIHRLDEEQLQGWLDKYSLSEMWESNVIGGRPSR